MRPRFSALLAGVLFAESLTGGGPVPVAHVDRLPPRAPAFTPQPFSPSDCRISYVTDPHPSRDVPDAIKVNVRTDCRVAVPELTLSVTLLDGSGKPLVKTMAKSVNKDYVMNQSTYITRKDHTTKSVLQGVALGTSWEFDGKDHKVFDQIKFGNQKEVACGY